VITKINKGNTLSFEIAEKLVSDGLAFFKHPNQNYEKSILLFNIAIELNPNESCFYRFRSFAKKGLGDFKGALDDLNLELKLDPNNTDSYIRRAYIKKQLEDFDGELMDLNKIIELEPDNSYYYFYRAQFMIRVSNYNAAILDLNKVIELNKIARSGYYLRGEIKFLNNDLSFKSDLKEALKLGCKNTEKFILKNNILID
jgi:tetratricopeptide (TPR) repeat protein